MSSVITGAARTLAGAATGLVADLAFGEPPISPHPVASYGSVMTRLEERIWRDSRRRGAAFAATGVALGVGVGALGGGSFVGTATATYLSAAGRGLADAAREVRRAITADDLERARAGLRSLVGRDPAELDEPEIVRAVIESVAENTIDAIVAPALWSALAGAPGALGYRAINTLDAMVGYHNERFERFGWAAARLDDGANYLPARVGALAVMACRPRRAAAVWRAVRQDAPGHPSPNAGVAEASFAAALNLRLGGTNHYGARVEHRPVLGSGRSPQAGDIDRAVRLSRDVTLTLLGAFTIAAAALTVRTARRATNRSSAPRAR